MKTRMWFGLGVLLLAPAVTWAQAASNNVNFQVPLRLTNLSPNIIKIIVQCEIRSRALSGGGYTTSWPSAVEPTSGHLNRTVDVHVRILNPIDISKSNVATYSCAMRGETNTSPRVVSAFSENHVNPDFRLSPTPTPITGSFEWRPITVAPSQATTTSP